MHQEATRGGIRLTRAEGGADQPIIRGSSGVVLSDGAHLLPEATEMLLRVDLEVHDPARMRDVILGAPGHGTDFPRSALESQQLIRREEIVRVRRRSRGIAYCARCAACDIDGPLRTRDQAVQVGDFLFDLSELIGVVDQAFDFARQFAAALTELAEFHSIGLHK